MRSVSESAGLGLGWFGGRRTPRTPSSSCRTMNSRSLSTSTVKGKMYPVIVTAESGSEEKIGENENDVEAIENPPRQPSVLSSVDQNLLAPRI